LGVRSAEGGARAGGSCHVGIIVDRWCAASNDGQDGTQCQVSDVTFFFFPEAGNRTGAQQLPSRHSSKFELCSAPVTGPHDGAADCITTNQTTSPARANR
jgi:hypothetical protein